MSSWNPLKKDWSAIWRNLREGEFNTIINGAISRISQVITYFFGKSGVYVEKEDWDYLIVLDACRYDFFEEENGINGELKKKKSRGSTTIEWLNENFTEYYEDLVYVSANAFVSPYDSNSRYQMKNFDSSKHFSDTEMVFLKENDSNPGIYPNIVSETALDFYDKYPEKRMIIHFIQPHAPYIGNSNIENKLTTLHDVRKAGYSKEEIREAYRDNLRLVINQVDKLVEKLGGKIVITADHGELLGELGLWNHPHSFRKKELVEVPWLTVNKKTSLVNNGVDF